MFKRQEIRTLIQRETSLQRRLKGDRRPVATLERPKLTIGEYISDQVIRVRRGA